MTTVSINKVKLNTFARFYLELKKNNPHAQVISELQTDFLASAEFETITGDAISKAMSHLALKSDALSQDKFTKLLEYCDKSLISIVNHPRYKIIREHDLVPIHKAQQLDSRSVQWLSRQPGDNIRQKLSSNPHVLALTRRNTLDTLENRFVHNIIIYIDYLLDIKRDACRLTEDENWLAQELDGWLSLNDVKEIKTWQAMPPNNVLLEDKQYKKVWRVGQKLNLLDDELSQISERIDVTISHRLFIDVLSYLQNINGMHLIEKNVIINVEKLIYHLDDISKYSESSTADNEDLQVEGVYEGKQVSFLYTRALDKKISNITLILDDKSKRCCKVDITSVQVMLTYSFGKSAVEKTSLWNIQDGQFSSNKIAQAIVKQWLGKLGGRRHFEQKIANEFLTLDLSGANPQFRMITSSEIGSAESTKEKLPLQLIAQKNSNKDVLDLSLATAIDLDVDAELLTQHSLYKAEVASAIADIISKSVVAPKVTYLLSDQISDFDSKIVRREFNRVFYRATPLPRSIAAAFSLQKKQHRKIKKGEVLVLLEQAIDTVYITPVVGCVTDTQSYWERHPSIKMDGDDYGLQSTIKKALGSDYPGEVITAYASLFNYKELTHNSRKPALKFKNQWYYFDKNICEKIKAVSFSIDKKVIIQALLSIGLDARSGLTVINTSSPSIMKGFSKEELVSNLDITQGSEALYELTKVSKVNDVNKIPRVYWRDHLPQLLTRLPKAGKEVELIFVDNKTSIEPRRGKRVDLKIKDKFTIPAGEKVIPLPIFQGQGKNTKRFSLQLSHASFPLVNDIICSLDLGYTYGDEEPYELIFKPENEYAPFNQIVATWSDWSMTPEQKMVFPEYPTVKSIEELRKFSSNGKKSTDILEWSEKVFNKIFNYHKFFIGDENSKRISMNIGDDGYRKDASGICYCRVEWFGKAVFIHQSEFEDGAFREDLYEISGDLVTSGSSYKLVKITPVWEIPKEEMKRLSAAWRFPILTLFDQNRCLADMPEILHDKAEAALNKAQELLLEYELPKYLEIELMQFVSYFHDSVSETIAKQWIDSSISEAVQRDQLMNMSYALGAVTTDWQKSILSNILCKAKKIRPETLDIIGTAIWRSESMIYELSLSDIGRLVNGLSYNFMAHKSPQWTLLLRRLELAFALIRLRGSNNTSVAQSMAVGGVNSDKLLIAVQTINAKFGSILFKKMISDSKVKCRVHLGNINKPSAFNKTPDILYALNMYLSGDDGANSITISEISSE